VAWRRVVLTEGRARPWPCGSCGRLLFLAWLVAAVLAAALPAAAEDVADPAAEVEEAKDAESREEPPRVFAEEIVVTATRSERAADELPVSVTLISEEEIDRTPVSQLDDLLRATPGANLPADSSAVEYPSRNTLSIRGLGGANRTLVLLDGIPLNDPMFGHVNWNEVQLGTVERVEVVRGGAGALYGGLAMGGTVHVISARPRDGEVAADLSYGSFDTRRGAVSAGRRLGPRVVLGVDLAAGDSDGHQRVPAELRQGIDGPSSWDRHSGRLQADVEISPAARGFVRGSFASYDLSLGTPYSSAFRDSRRLAAGLELDALGGGEAAVHLFWQDLTFDNENVRILPGGDDGYRSNANHGPTDVLGGSVQWSRALGPRVPLVGFGVDARRGRAGSYRRNFDAEGAVVSTQAAAGEQLTAGVFAQGSWAPVRRLELLAGVRADWWRNEDGFTRLPGREAETFAARSAVEVSPRLAARWALSPDLGLRAAAYGAFGPPTLRDLYRSSAFRGQENLPNPRLEPERLTGGELGLELGTTRLQGQVNLFHNEIDDVIADVTLAREPVLVSQPQNVGTARSRGAELFGELFLDERWSVTGSYVYTDAEVIDSRLRPDLEGKRIALVPEDWLSAGVTWRAAGGGSVSLRAVYTSGTFEDAENELAFDGRTLVDLFATWPLGRGLEVYGALTNAFDEEYLADLSSTLRLGSPRQLRAGVRVRTALPGSAAAAAR
jgi:outer membrane receptor protein involved in Fe transport